MTVADRVRAKLATIRGQLAREDLSTRVKAAWIVDSALAAAHLAPYFGVHVHRLFELTAPPTVMRGLRDLVVRAGTLDDLASVCAVEDTPAPLFRERLARGDALFVGILDERVLAHIWFHVGAPFDEDAPKLARWGLAPGTVWSFAAAAAPDARTSGVFIKVFQFGLRAMLTAPGAARVQCLIRGNNTGSIALHERLGFREIAQLTTVSTPVIRTVRWVGAGAGAEAAARSHVGRGARLLIELPS